MWIVVGLGNPGGQYASDRHNIGFDVVDELCETAGGEWLESQHQCLLAKVSTESDQEVLLVKPLTYMNLSGNAVSPLCDYYQLTAAHVLIVHDELELPFGRTQLKRGGGESGHRGLLSVTEALGSRDYLRLRFGIGRPVSTDIAISDYVLSPFSDEEQPLLPDLVTYAADTIRCCCEQGEQKAMSQFNRRRKPKADRSPL
jgi:PTH1 family peptidyl-tRNA hydrolase